MRIRAEDALVHDVEAGVSHGLMTESMKTRLTPISAPCGREVRLDDVAYPSGMRLLRLTVREGSRYTVMEIDAATAREWADAMRAWADASATG